MKIDYRLPKGYCELESCLNIFLRLRKYLADDHTLVCRSWEDKSPMPEGKYISIITSCEQHNHIPPEKDDPNCISIFMHYYPTTDPFNPSLQYNHKIFPLCLGTKNEFRPDGRVPMQERKYSVGFIGQFDPYRRVQFKKFAMACAARYPDSFIQFYDGWNKGVNSGEYSYLMGQFKIALVPCGSASLNTFRYYEAMSSGCIVMREELYSHPSVKRNLGDEIITDWSNHDQLFRTIDSYIKSKCIDQGRIANIRHYNNFYSPEACAEYIMDHIKEINA
jgi:hypothetical protein